MTRKEEAYRILKKGILDGSYAPDSFLQETEVAEELGMSRTPIREALLTLERENLIAIVPQKGARVAKMDVQDIVEISRVREEIEVIAVKWAVGKIDKSSLQKLRDGIEKMRVEYHRAPGKPDLESFAFGDRVHKLIFESANNRSLSSVYGTVADQFTRLVNLSRRTRDYSRVCAEHLEICDAMLRDDVVSAEKAMREHIRNVTQDILSLDAYFRDELACK